MTRLLKIFRRWQTHRLVQIVAYACCSLTIASCAIRIWMIFAAIPYTKQDEWDAAVPMALVLGAKQGSMTLLERVDMAANLYLKGKVSTLLMSGDRSAAQYDEPAWMAQRAQSLGVPHNAILLDPDGKRTLDSCQRARSVFGASRVIIVTQQFHLARAVYLCRHLGLGASGVAADNYQRDFVTHLLRHGRELAASTVAWLEMQW
jgi:vancomycin permeability regulator SanA